jgi:hypothetical protein
MNDRQPGAFHTQYRRSSDMHVWIKTFFNLWTELMWLVLKVVLLPRPTSACDRGWSIEDLILSKWWKRLGQELVERLVHTDVNLKFDHRLEFYEADMFPWHIEMSVEEPFSDDVDGVPHCVSDSESESTTDSSLTFCVISRRVSVYIYIYFIFTFIFIFYLQNLCRLPSREVVRWLYLTTTRVTWHHWTQPREMCQIEILLTTFDITFIIRLVNTQWI